MSRKWVYDFGGKTTDGDASMRDLLGGKGANLAEMAHLGLPIPPGFTITTEACNAYYANDRKMPDGLADQVAAALKRLEATTSKGFGDPSRPLLVSVRSGARASMPGMMDTVLNLGLNTQTAEGLVALSGDARFARDTHRRFIQMYANVVLDAPHESFEEILDDYKLARDIRLDTEMSADNWCDIIGLYQDAETIGTHDFPDDPGEQIWGAIRAVFNSWMNRRAKTYRALHDIPGEWGTAVTVQAMVFGNMGEDSATGVCFTRNPSTGEHVFYGEYLVNAQGEDVVAGIRTPAPISTAHGEAIQAREMSLEEKMPDVYQRLHELAGRLEAHYRDMQDIEFTVEKGRLFLLQTRSGKRTIPAALRLAVEMCAQKIISHEEAVLRVDPDQLDQLLHPTLAPDTGCETFVSGLPASPGAAVGKLVFCADEAADMAARGEDVILMRLETSPEDIHGMHAARAIVTARGGMTSHAAVVARGMGRPCVCGAGGLRIDSDAGTASAGGRSLRRGDIVTIDGTSGRVFVGAATMVAPDLGGDFATLMSYADRFRRMRVRANAETPDDVRRARDFGAEGIGLCRTEHMFFDASRIRMVRAMILATDNAQRQAALEALLPMQRDDFAEIFRIMESSPCTIRLLDPPLHEFLPHSDEDYGDVAEALGTTPEALRARAGDLYETNPMLGHRGCRLGITFPDIYAMQARAILEAGLHVAASTGTPPVIEIMIPLAGSGRELELTRACVEETAHDVFEKAGRSIPYLIGAMIELPRAALRAADIAVHAHFFSFGTNDLTQMTLGLSRDDAGHFLGVYSERNVYGKDPFTTLDIDGVGELIALAAQRGREGRTDIKLGVCGEHGGDPASIAFFEEVGLEYVSCSPYRVPVARLAAAHATLKSSRTAGSTSR